MDGDKIRSLEHSMWQAPVAANRFELLKFSASRVSAHGMVMEFGVGKGTSLKRLSDALPHSRLYGFDSQQGLPEHWDRDGDKWQDPKGSFSFQPKAEDIGPNVELVTGWYEDTIPEFLNKYGSYVAQELSLVHIDCDIYSSTKTVLGYLKPYMRRSGIVIVFDELTDFRQPLRYKNWREHEWKALVEADLNIRPIGRTPTEQVAFEIIA